MQRKKTNISISGVWHRAAEREEDYQTDIQRTGRQAMSHEGSLHLRARSDYLQQCPFRARLEAAQMPDTDGRIFHDQASSQGWHG